MVPKKIIFTRSNSCSPDPRIEKEVSTLVEAGYNVGVLAWDRECRSLKNENFKGYRIHRIGVKSPYGSFRLFFYLILWNISEFFYLLKEDFDIIHACCLDTLIPAYFVAKIRRKKIVYDIFDFYADALPLGSPKFLRNFISFIEKFFIKRVDGVIIVDESRFEQVGGNNGKISVIMNTPYDHKERIAVNKSKSKIFLVFFAGILATNRSIVEMAKVVEGIPKSEFILAGFGENTEKILNGIKLFKKTKFIGRLPYSEVLKKSITSDVLFAIYDPRIPNHKVSSANKLFEAMMCSKPIIVAKGTSMDKIVEKEKCGLVVDYGNVNQLKEALIKLKNNPALSKSLGRNGRKAYEERYNWEVMGKRLVLLYKNLK